MRHDKYLPDNVFDSAHWQKATASEPGKSCVEFAKVRNVIAVRDSKVSGGAILQFTENEIAALLSGVKNGEFDHLV